MKLSFERSKRASWLPRAALALLLAYGVLLFARRSTSVGGSDSSGYLNAARAIAAGTPLERMETFSRLRQPVERQRMFIPLGYVPGRSPATMATVYPIGLPLHTILLAALFGWSFGPFLIGPLSAVLSVLLVYKVAREIDLSTGASIAAAAMFACAPVLNFLAVQFMSDVPAAFWGLAAVWFSLKSRRRASWGAAAGLAFGIAVLVRPSSALLLLPIALALAPSLRAWSAFLAGGVPPAGALFAFNRAAYGGMLETGYSDLDESAFTLGNFPVRARHYAYWISAMMSPLILPAWVAGILDRLRPLRVRLMLFVWFAAFFAFYGFYSSYDAWWYTRFLLPGIPALAISAAMVGEDALARSRTLSTAQARRISLAAVALSFAVICGVAIRLGDQYRVLDVGRGESVYPETIRWARSRVPAHSLVLAEQFSGAMRAYGWGEFVRWDWVEPKDFAPFRREMEGAGYRFYALLFPFEVEQCEPLGSRGWKIVGSNRDASLFELPLSAAD